MGVLQITIMNIFTYIDSFFAAEIKWDSSPMLSNKSIMFSRNEEEK